MYTYVIVYYMKLHIIISKYNPIILNLRPSAALSQDETVDQAEPGHTHCVTERADAMSLPSCIGGNEIQQDTRGA